ncbi:MFS transporter [Acidianus brierleyi]|uniref:Major facilitator superfamily (MFS) profile domain-containing protein n=1 Tax=Acidianus brierleyi TaxID=41673 RepID=A0A2U9IGY7_9CREN|nr:MFS transporter [Acidianus brierleyi]AWR95303.1 MFS transporter [Acidianus brierleyi]
MVEKSSNEKIMDNSKVLEVEKEIQKNKSVKYKIFLVITAWLGWTMVVYEWNMFSLLLGPVSNILKLTSFQVGLMLSSIQFGLAIGVFLSGYFLDIVGRKLYYQISLLITSILTGVTGIATYAGLIPLILTRVGAQALAQNEQPTAASLITEEMPARWRALIYSFVQSGWPFGVAIAGLIAATLYKPLGFTYIWLVAIIPMILIVIARRWIKESDRFEEIKKARKGNIDEKTGIITDISKVKKSPYRQAFERDVRKLTLRSILLYTLYLAGQVPLVLLAAYYMEELLHLSVVETGTIISIGSFITIPGYVTAGAISELIGRKYGGTIGTLLALIGIIWFALSPPIFIQLLLSYSFASFWINGNFANVINYINETVPTRIRGTVNVLSAAVGQLGWGITSLIYGTLIGLIGITGDIIIIGAIGFLISIIIFMTGKNIKPGTPLEAISR